MVLVNNTINQNSLVDQNINRYNLTESNSSLIKDLLKENNLIDIEALSKEELSLIFKRIDEYDGLFTTQQLENIDFSDFKNHVFFDSAADKVSYSFNEIQNIPYDKSKIENIKYKNKTDGYTNYVLKNLFPKNKGFVNFTGNEIAVTYDEQGKFFKQKNKKIGLLNPKNKNYSFEFWLNPNDTDLVTHPYQVIFSKIEVFLDTDGITYKIKNGFICYLTHINNDTCFLNFTIYSNSNHYNRKTIISKNNFQNITISVSKKKSLKKTSFLIDGNLIDEDNIIEIGSLSSNSNFGEVFKEKYINFSIGGIFAEDLQSNYLSNNITLYDDNLCNNFRGYVDEFRFFHKTRSKEKIKKDMHKNIYSQNGLVLYYRFNEPGGNYTNSFLNIDYSGNKLYGLNYTKVSGTIEVLSDTSNFRNNLNTPLKLENDFDSPVINPSFNEVIDLRASIINKAKEFDKQNPNIIFNLLPKHYFLDSSEIDNLPVYSNNDVYSTQGSVVDDNNQIIKKNTLDTKLPANNELVNIVLIWARFFDQLKLYISSITNMINIDYDTINQKKVVGMQIPLICKLYGIKFEEILPTITSDKLDNFNLNYEDIYSEISIRKIQNILWQRFLINTQDFLKSKGTIKSIESVFNSFGVDYRNLIKIREYSSNNNILNKSNNDLVSLQKYSVDFSNKISGFSQPTYNDNEASGFSVNKLFLEIPDIKSKENNQSLTDDNIQNGLGNDWSIEIFLDFKEIINNHKIITNSKNDQYENFLDKSFENNQYLFRIDSDDDNENLVVVYFSRINKFASKGTIIVEIRTYLNDEPDAGNYNSTLSISNVNIFDDPKYFILSQKIENNDISYYAELKSIGSQTNQKNKSFSEDSLTINNLDSNKIFSNKLLNFRIGDFNYNLEGNIESSSFQGQIFKIRFWKKFLTQTEIFTHSNSIDNIGIENDIFKNKLIADFEIKNKEDAKVNNTLWSMTDVSNNKYNNAGILSDLNKCNIKTNNSLHDTDTIINLENIFCKRSNYKIDESTNYNKVNITSFSEDHNKQNFNNFNSFPSNQIPVDFLYDKSQRVSVDMSIVNLINEDISNIIVDLNKFIYQISNTQSMYHYQYKSLENFKDQYFDKFSDSNYINYASIGNVFKYFDNIMSSILYDIIPSKIDFQGFNFIVESHILERHKYEHKNKFSNNTLINQNQIQNFSRENNPVRRNIFYNQNRSQINNK